ncbi:hypothetical protein AJ88_08935 [Mesorhizobium amorphae CCBAU 01583]|nr:hypothetical protein AJ88_08935 [Mesorhizobium amorphae CCBAU 01583]
MATGASTADLAIVLIDARQGVLRQTRRHSIIASLLGIRHIVLAVNKIDLVGFDHGVFDRIVEDYRQFSQELGFQTVMPIPMSARYGDNVTGRSDKTKWYSGPTLIEHLENVSVDEAAAELPFRFPVQYVNRPNLDFRGLPAPSRPARSHRVTRSSSPNPENPRVSGASSRMAAISARRLPARPSPWFSTTRSRSRVATCWCRRQPDRRSPTSSPPTSSGSTNTLCCPAAPTSCAPRPTRPAPPSPT